MTFAAPFSYIHKHRKGLIDSSRQHMLHHFKEVFVRFPIGYGLGFAATLFLFGNVSKDAPISQGLIIGGNTEVKEDKSIDESNTSLDYSADLLKNSRTRRYIPGKIRD